ncbi:hypothetical protein D3C72_1488560 [compost metagenome]
MSLMGMIEGAGKADPAIFDIAAAFCDRLDIGKRHRICTPPLLDIGHQRLFPVEPLHLPGAKPEKDGKRQQHQRRGEPDAPFRGLHVGNVIHDQACLRLHCSCIAAQS